MRNARGWQQALGLARTVIDDVVFDDSGSTMPAVNLIGDQTPASVTVAADVSYTFSGTGRITGTTGLSKTNAGKLTINVLGDRLLTTLKVNNIGNEAVQHHVFGDVIKRQIVGELRMSF